MIQPYQIGKNIKFLPCTFALLFALLGLSITPPSTYAAASAIPSVLSSNWSGFEASGPVGTFKKSQCTTKIPKVTTPGDVSVWCGLGGDPNSINPNNPTTGAQQAVLVQAGIDACLNSTSCTGNCRRSIQCNSIWWEIADALVVQPIRFNRGIHIGDTIYIYMQSNLHNDNVDLFNIQNRTTRESHTIRVTNQGATMDGRPIRIIGSQPRNGIPIVSDGASVECIVERPLDVGSNTFIHLATFQSATVTGCDDGPVDQSYLEPISSVPTLTRINMFNDTNSSRGSTQRANAPSVIILAQPTDLFGPLLDRFTVIQNPKTQTQTITNSIAHFMR